MKWVVLAIVLLTLTGCASVRAVMWSKASDWADELDGSDDVPSVDFNNEEKL